MAPHEPESISVDTPDGRVISGHPDAVHQMMASMERQAERRKRWPLTASGDTDTRRAMTVLARSFPTLRKVDGVEPWDVDRFLAWLCSPAPSHGMLLAGQFVLGVWNHATDWREAARELGLEGADKLGRFDLFEAMGIWDGDHIAACRSWIEAPFWP